MKRTGLLAAALAAAAFLLGPSPIPAPGILHGPVPVPRPFAARVSRAPLPPAPVAAVQNPAARVAPDVRRGGRLYHLPPMPSIGSREERARGVLARYGPRLGLDRMPGTLTLRRSFTSPVGEHVRFGQEVDGIAVFGSEVSVHTAPDGRILVVNADVFAVPEQAAAAVVPSAEALATAIEETGAEDAAAVESKDPVLAWLPEGKSARLAWRVEVRSEQESLRVFVDARDGEVIEAQDLRHSAEGEGRVFQPNPVFSARDKTLRDNGDVDATALTAQLFTVPLHRLDGSGYLRGSWADVTPTKSPALSAALSFLFTRADDRFEQVNVYHHIDAVQDYIQNALGYDDILARPQKADAHANSQDNSYFDDYNARLYFGDGGVDDGEDGDIVAHEYGHALQNDMVTDFGLSEEAGAMGEGFGDYQAASRHQSGFPSWDAAVASWDATSFSSSNPPALRRVDGTKHYPEDLVGEVHADGEIWSSALWAVRAALGRTEADRIIVGSHLLLTARAAFADGAAAVVATNLSLRGGADEAAVRAAFESRGLPVGDDTEEENDGPASATFVAQPDFPGLFLADEDWFRFTVPGGSSVTVRAESLDYTPRLELTLYGEDLVPLDSSSGAGGKAVVTTPAGAATRDFLVRAFSPRGERFTYDLSFTGGVALAATDPFEPNDSLAAAADLPTGAPMDLRLSTADDDWFRLGGAAGSRVRALATFNGAALDLDLELRAPDGTPLAASATAGSSESIDFTVPDAGPGEVLLRVHAASGTGAYTLTAFVDPPTLLPKSGKFQGSVAAGEERTLGLTVTPPEGGSLVVRVTANRVGRKGARPEVEIVSPGGFVISPFGAGLLANRTDLEFTAPEPGKYLLRIRPVAPTQGKFKVKTRLVK